MADAPAIETHNLSKTYASGVQALVDVDLRVERGEVFGYLGPNGAGKSTTIRLLLDLIRATAERAEILGRDTRMQSVDARRQVGYVPGDFRLSDKLTEGANGWTRLPGCRRRRAGRGRAPVQAPGPRGSLGL